MLRGALQLEKYPVCACEGRRIAEIPQGGDGRAAMACEFAALTVAQLSGTSVAMIEKHYGHLVRDDAEEALASVAV